MKDIISILLLFFGLQTFCRAQWQPQTINAPGYMGGLQFVNENVGWLFTNNPSKIYKTTDGGITWFPQHETDGPVVSRFILDANNGWFTDLDSFGGRLAFTSDGGTHWIQRFPASSYFFNELYFFDLLNGIAIGSMGAPQVGAIFKTTSGGAQWNVVHTDISIAFGLFFLNDEVGWCGTVGPTGNLLKTTDGGNNWTPVISNLDGAIVKIKFFNEQTGSIICNGNLYSTTNGGTTWNLNVESVQDFHFVDLNIGWYINEDKIYFTIDGGANWSIQYSNPNNNLLNIYFYDSQLGWATGENGYLLRTTNGGTPVELNSFTANVNGSNVTLNWSTSSEANNSGFEVYRKKTGERSQEREWKLIGFVEGSGTTTEQKYYTFKDEHLSEGIYSYRIKQIDFDGTYKYYDLSESVEIGSPNKFELSQNYPNPFNPSTKIKYSVADAYYASPAWVTLKVYDILGNEVTTLVNEYKQAGSYEVEFQSTAGSRQLASGVYYYQLKAGSFIETKKMLMIK